MRRHRHLALLLAGVVLVAGCSRDKGDRAAGDRGDGSEADTTTATAEVAGDGATTTVAAAESVGAQPAGTGSPSARVPAFAAAGTYRYDLSGKASSPVTPEQPITGSSTLTVEPPTGTDQRQVTSGEHQSIERIVRDGGGPVLLTYLKLSGQGALSEFRPEPPVVASPNPLVVGALWAWTMTSTDGKTKLTGEFKAVRTEKIDIGGTPVDCVVVEATLQYDGDAKATQKQTLWMSPQLALTAREETITDAGSFHSETTSRLLSTTPA